MVVYCPKCGGAENVGERTKGRQRCAKCGVSFLIDSAKTTKATPQRPLSGHSGTTSQETRRGRRVVKRTQGEPVIGTGTGLAIFAGACLLILGLWMMWDKSSTAGERSPTLPTSTASGQGTSTTSTGASPKLTVSGNASFEDPLRNCKVYLLKRNAELSSLHEEYCRTRTFFSLSTVQLGIAESGFKKAKSLADRTTDNSIRQRADEQTLAFIDQKIQALKDMKAAREKLIAMLPRVKPALSKAIATATTNSTGDYSLSESPRDTYFVFLEFRLPDGDANLFYFEEVSGQGAVRCDMKRNSFIP